MAVTWITIAGWLTMISAFASIPMTYLAFKLEGQVDSTGILILAIMQVAGTILFVAVTLFFKKLLNRIFNFHDTDKSIDLMIMANVVAGILVVVGMHFYIIGLLSRRILPVQAPVTQLLCRS